MSRESTDTIAGTGPATRGLYPGKQIGRLTLVLLTHKMDASGRLVPCWLCRCSCGQKKAIRRTQLYGPVPATHSCGCLLDEPLIEAGAHFGRWTVVRLLPKDDPRVQGKRGRYYLCRCACGITSAISAMNLGRIDGESGCSECARLRQTKHGHNIPNYRSAEYNSWCNMRQRCDPRYAARYPTYVGRGIQVCDRWQNDFQAFLTDVGMKPSDKHQLHRIDNDGNYEPGNVGWVLPTENSRNKTSSHRITAFGKTLCLAEWAERAGLRPTSIMRRLRSGWKPELAVTAPQGSRAKRGRTVTALGKTLTLIEWSDETGISPQAIDRRLQAGWSPEDAVSRPVAPSGKTRRDADQPSLW